MNLGAKGRLRTVALVNHEEALLLGINVDMLILKISGSDMLLLRYIELLCKGFDAVRLRSL